MTKTQADQNQIRWLLDAATSRFKSVSDTPKLDAELLLCQILDCTRTYLFTWPDKVLEESQSKQFEQLCLRRELGEPIAHIVGEREFWTLSLDVNPSTLIPRPDTEILVEQALKIAQSFSHDETTSTLKGLDLGTGTGAIALALASELAKWQWLGVDFSPEAVELARQNQSKNNIKNCHFVQSDWFSNLDDTRFDLIVSNPPYIDGDDPHLEEGDVRFEPLTALVAEEKGLADIRKILQQGRSYLIETGAILIEHGYRQGVEVRDLFKQHGYLRVHTIKDLSGNDRVSIGYLK